VVDFKKLTDSELIEIWSEGAGDHPLSELIGRYNKTILRKCRSYVKTDDEAKDLAQEVAIKVFLRINSYQKKARFSTWLYSIIHNTCIDYIRRSKHSLKEVITDKMKDEVAELVYDTDEVEEKLSALVIEKLLDHLSQEEKVLLLLKYKEKQSIKDIMHSMNLTESAVKMRLKRAREKATKIYRSYKHS